MFGVSRRVVVAATFTTVVLTLLVFVGVRQNSSVRQNPRNTSLSFRRIDPSSPSSGAAYAFKILQLADLHIGEAPNKDWGPIQDAKTWVAVRSVLRAEEPDLVVLSGDQLAANNIDGNATTYYRKLIDVMRDAQPGVRWCMIFGNHDDSAFCTRVAENGTVIYTDAKTTRDDLMKLDMSFTGSVSRRGPAGVFGTSNYVLPLHLGRLGSSATVAAEVYFFDSGGGSLPQAMEENQIEWFRNASLRSAELAVPAVAFQHIPVNNEFLFQDETCEGFDGDGGIAPLASDPGVLDVLAEHGDVHFLAVGHNHGNDYCCRHSGALHLCFGRHSGYGGYGTWDRGARVYELRVELADADSDSGSPESSFSWRSWVRMESGGIVDRYEPSRSDGDGDGDTVMPS